MHTYVLILALMKSRILGATCIHLVMEMSDLWGNMCTPKYSNTDELLPTFDGVTIRSIVEDGLQFQLTNVYPIGGGADL